jgi:hypothetical protein
MLFDAIFDLFRRDDDNINVFAEGEAKILGRARIERINQRNAQRVAGHPNRKRAMETGQAAWNQLQDLGPDLSLAKIDILGSERVSDGLVKSVLVDKAAIHHGLGDGFSIQARFVENVLDLRGLQNMLLDEKFGDLFVVHG